MSGIVETAITRLRRLPFASSDRNESGQFSTFELWPSLLFYAPLAVQWAVLALRHRSLTLPTIANPGMQCGGLVGESKSEILDQLGAEGTRYVAPYTTFTTGTGAGAPISDLPQALATLATAGLHYPFVAKPDIGCRGAGVRVIRDESELATYLETYPRHEKLIFQKLIEAPHEAGVFYIRAPGEERGRIVSVTLKVFPEVIGDGESTLEQLILADPRARHLKDIYLKRHAAQKDRVLARGETFRLVFTGNHCRGAIFKDGRAAITPEMTATFDAIARGMPEFYVGRFDVRYENIDDLMAGKNFWMIEVNGAGSEATHIWDKDSSIEDAYKFLFYQQRVLFEFGAMNRRRGFSTITVYSLLKMLFRQNRLVKMYSESS
jgi:hypothetical protein